MPSRESHFVSMPKRWTNECRWVAAFLVLAATAITAEVPAAAAAMALAREATAAAAEKDVATYLAKMEQAAALRPDFPRILVNLAAAQVANHQLDEAVASLERLAALGLHSPVDKSADFAPLRGRKDFDAVVKKIAGNLVAKGLGTIVFSLPGVTGLIEGIAWREKTGQFFFSDVNGRAVWVRKADGTLAGTLKVHFDEFNDAHQIVRVRNQEIPWTAARGLHGVMHPR